MLKKTVTINYEFTYTRFLISNSLATNIFSLPGLKEACHLKIVTMCVDLLCHLKIIFMCVDLLGRGAVVDFSSAVTKIYKKN